MRVKERSRLLNTKVQGEAAEAGGEAAASSPVDLVRITCDGDAKQQVSRADETALWEEDAT